MPLPPKRSPKMRGSKIKKRESDSGFLSPKSSIRKWRGEAKARSQFQKKISNR